jgi:ABC-2 type transport system permease protein
MNMRRLAHLIYIGFQLAKMHITSYVASIVSSVLWFSIMFIPTVLFSGLGVQALLALAPGVYAMAVAMSAMWVSTEFLRWNVYHGLTDLFRECGLNVFHYLLSNSIVDVIFTGFASYFLSIAIASAYLKISITAALPQNPIYIALATLLAIPVYLLMGALIGYLMTSTNISGVWVNIIQILTTFGTVVPPKIFPNPWIALANPATIVAELFRAGYGINNLPLTQLLTLTPLFTAIFIVVSSWIGLLCERRIARYGMEYRY